MYLCLVLGGFLEEDGRDPPPEKGDVDDAGEEWKLNHTTYCFLLHLHTLPLNQEAEWQGH